MSDYTKLTANQLAVKKQIEDYGKENNFTASQISTAVKVAFIESSLGINMQNPTPGATASGLFGYTTKHGRKGIRNLEIKTIHQARLKHISVIFQRLQTDTTI